MGARTGIVRFNVNDRARNFLGKKRNFNMDSLMRTLNGGAAQERVTGGDAVGYYTHWARNRFGMDPREGGVVDGKHVVPEAAVRCLFIKAYPDGTIEHEHEFLDTDAGQCAQKIWESKVGGWSSAIDARRMGGVDYPYAFYGFDYVYEPNYADNRGYLDDTSGDGPVDIVEEQIQYQQMVRSTIHMLDSVRGDLKAALQMVGKLQEENIELAAMYRRDIGAKPEPILDGVQSVVRVRAKTPYDDAEKFGDLRLPGYEQPQADREPTKDEQAVQNYTERRWGV